MKENALGRHLLVELYDCDTEILNDPKLIQSYMEEAAIASGATIVSSHTNLFNPYGVSGVVIIAESHITVHTWPEHAYAAVDAFTCGESVNPSIVEDVLKERLKSKRTTSQELKRGIFSHPVSHKAELSEENQK